MVNRKHNDRARFDRAKGFAIKFGRFKGQTLNQAAESDDGLAYLDWMSGLDDLRPDFRTAIDDFLGYEVVARDLDGVLAARERRKSR